MTESQKLNMQDYDEPDKPDDFFPATIAVKNPIIGWYQLVSASRKEVIADANKIRRKNG